MLESALSSHVGMRGVLRLLGISAAVVGTVFVLYSLYSSSQVDSAGETSLAATRKAGMDRNSVPHATIAAIAPTLRSIYAVHARDVDGDDFDFETLRGKVRECPLWYE